MEPSGNLAYMRRTLSGTLRVQTTPIATDDLNLGMPPEPIGRAPYVAIFEHVDNLASFQVHNDGPVAPGTAPAPVINTNNPGRT
jgi:hypothetical protein